VILEFFTTGFAILKDPVNHPEKEHMHQDKKYKYNKIRSAERWQQGVNHQKT
jgi:hypothetical protein